MDSNAIKARIRVLEDEILERANVVERLKETLAKAPSGFARKDAEGNDWRFFHRYWGIYAEVKKRGEETTTFRLFDYMEQVESFCENLLKLAAEGLSGETKASRQLPKDAEYC